MTKARRGITLIQNRKKFKLDTFFQDIHKSPVAFMEICHYQGKQVQKFKQTKRLLRLISECDKSIAVLPRGASKSFSFAIIALWYFYTHENFRVAIFSRSHRQSKAVLEICSDIIDSSPLLKTSRQSFQIDQKQRLKSHINSEIIAHPFDASTVLGEHPDIVLADECAFFGDDSFFRKVILPMQSGVRTIYKIPKISLVSTIDQDEGFFYDVWKNPEKYGYTKLKMTWQQCDGYTKEDMQKKKIEIGARAFASQYECEAQSTTSSFFTPSTIEGCIRNCDYKDGITIGGIDLAKKKDYASISVVEKRDNNFNLIVNFQTQLNYTDLARISKQYEKEYLTTSFLVDTTTGEEFVDFASKEPYLVSLKPFAFTSNSKKQILDYLRIVMEQKRLAIPERFHELISDMRRYQYSDHLPDTISSLALSLWNEKALSQRKLIKEIYAVTND